MKTFFEFLQMRSTIYLFLFFIREKIIIRQLSRLSIWFEIKEFHTNETRGFSSSLSDVPSTRFEHITTKLIYHWTKMFSKSNKTLAFSWEICRCKNIIIESILNGFTERQMPSHWSQQMKKFIRITVWHDMKIIVQCLIFYLSNNFCSISPWFSTSIVVNVFLYFIVLHYCKILFFSDEHNKSLSNLILSINRSRKYMWQIEIKSHR